MHDRTRDVGTATTRDGPRRYEERHGPDRILHQTREDMMYGRLPDPGLTADMDDRTGDEVAARMRSDRNIFGVDDGVANEVGGYRRQTHSDWCE